MDKKEIIKQLKAAKSAHIKWRSYAQALVAGLPVSEEKVPAKHTNCTFGRWYYGPGQRLASLPAFQAIETPHQHLHDIYRQIFNLLFEVEQKEAGFFQRLLGASRKQPGQQERIDLLLNSLIEVSKTLLAATELLEQEVEQLNEQEIQALAKSL